MGILDLSLEKQKDEARFHLLSLLSLHFQSFNILMTLKIQIIQQKLVCCTRK